MTAPINLFQGVNPLEARVADALHEVVALAATLGLTYAQLVGLMLLTPTDPELTHQGVSEAEAPVYQALKDAMQLARDLKLSKAQFTGLSFIILQDTLLND